MSTIPTRFADVPDGGLFTHRLNLWRKVQGIKAKRERIRYANNQHCEAWCGTTPRVFDNRNSVNLPADRLWWQERGHDVGTKK